ncbi:orotate phosphoribosyltransferase [Desulfohalovibrio reitneri]|uniref:orotate phosphoribosyltransferase n=1 Tax=Desulfohalovibrio reitneri TaxID=1307759 RepID=UPI0004A776AE|nr:orotate phosphoribosyltransferase [Desulfohalovibrio reitneri]
MNDHKARLAKLLMEKSYVAGEITLSSGRKSDYYFDCKQTAYHPEGAWLLGNLLLDALDGLDVDGVGGLTLGADPLVTAVNVVSYERGTPLPGFIVRKEAKGHGTGRFVEGAANLAPGARVAVLEDVVTSGGSVLKAVERIREAGFEVACVVAVLDRHEGGTEALADAGLDLRSLFTRPELVEAGG